LSCAVHVATCSEVLQEPPEQLLRRCQTATAVLHGRWMQQAAAD
jgi:hypothetical protein